MALSPALYWNTVPTQAANITFTDALGAANKVMQDAGLVNINLSEVDVSGRTANCHAAITFLKTGGSFTAIIMVAGTDDNETKAIRSNLSDRIDKLVWL